MNDTNSVMDLTLSQIGLFLATGILLTVVFSLVFSSDWQRTAELESLASSFSNYLGDIDNNFFEQTARYQFSHKDYVYSVKISTEYVVISSEGSWESDLFITNRFLTRPWLRIPHQNWTSGNDLHVYLNQTCGHRGTENDSIPTENFTQLCKEQNHSTSYFALHPLEIDISEPVFVEKVTIFYDQTKRHDFLLIYQMIDH